MQEKLENDDLLKKISSVYNYYTPNPDVIKRSNIVL